MKCPLNNKLKCWISKNKIRDELCPIADNNSDFWDELIIWAGTNRSAKCVRLDLIPGTNNFDDIRQVAKANVYRLFDDGSAVLDAIEKATMTKSVCKDLIRGRKLWIRTETGQAFKDAKRVVDRQIFNLTYLKK